MNAANREKVKELLSRAARLPANDRIAFIQHECGPDRVSAAEAIDLLATLDDSEFMSAPTGVGLAAALPGSTLPGEKPGTQIDRYKLLQLIGEGGFGSVYMADQFEPVHRRVALKIIKAGMDTRQVIARFEAERQALAMMDHPNIARVLDAGATQAGRPYFVMELVRGEPVTAYCDNQGMPIRKRLELFRDICLAVQHAHQKGIIHRDLKPSNVLVTVADGKPMPKVIDFGIAKATAIRLTDKTLFTEMHQLIGTPEYMSPEQAEVVGVDIDTRSDVYSLGVMLYELLSGTTPLERGRLRATPLAEIQRLIREEEPPRPSLRFATMASTPPPATPLKINDSSALDIAHRRQSEPAILTRTLRGELDWIVMKCLEKDRSRRYVTANALADDVSRYLTDQPVNAMPPSRTYQLRKFAGRNKALVTSMVAIILVLGAATIVSVAFGLSESRQRKATEIARIRAEKAEKDSLVRADELEQVAKFQQMQLSGIDAQSMGVKLRADLLHRARMAAERSKLKPEEVDSRVASLEELISGSDFTGIALEALDDNSLQPALKAVDEQFGGNPLMKARLLQTLASTQRQLGLLDAAEHSQAEALAIRRQMLGDDHPDTLGSMAEWGLLLQDQGRLADAEVHVRGALEKRRHVLGDDHPDTLSSTKETGYLFWAQGKLAEAEPLMREALERRRRVLGDDHIATLDAIDKLGILLREQGKLVEAESLAREGLERRRRVLGNEHRDTLASVANLATLLKARGNLSEAEQYDREALEKYRRVLGDDHPHTLIAINNMGVMMQSLGKMAEAESFYREGLEKSVRVLGHDHPDTLSLISNLAVLIKNLGRLPEAESLSRESVEGRRRILGDDHPHTLMSISNLASVLSEQGKLEEAEPYMREALEKRRRVLGDEHPDTLTSLGNVSLLLQNQGKLDEAEAMCREALAIRRRVLGDEHPYTLNSINNLGGLLKEKGAFAEAETFSREALEIRRRKLGDEHRETITSILNLAILFNAQNKLSEAEPYSTEALEKCRRVLGDQHPLTLSAIGNMGSLLRSQGHSQDAIELLAPAEPAVRRAFTGGSVRRAARFLTILGRTRVATGEFEAAEANLTEAYAILTEAKGATDRDRADVLTGLVELCDARQAAEPDKGHDVKAAAWRARLDELTSRQ